MKQSVAVVQDTLQDDAGLLVEIGLYAWAIFIAIVHVCT